MSKQMRNSGIDWIGQLPLGWDIEKVGKHFKNRNTKVSDKDYDPLSTTKFGVVPQLENVAKTSANDERKLVQKGDFVINSRSDRKQSCGISEYNGSVSLINTVLEPHSHKLLSCFTKYVLNNYGFAEEFYRWGTGIVADLWSTKWDLMKRIAIPIPHVAEQQKIASFLDTQCAEIDSLISLHEKMSEELKAYKRSVITEAVTKGLDRSVPMKYSGIEWIGEIPEHWGIIKLKYISSYSTLRCSDNLKYIGLENIESGSGRYLETENNYDTTQAIQCEIGDVLLGKLRPYLAKVFVVNEQICCSTEFLVFKDNKCPEYLKYLLLSEWFIKLVDSSTYGAKMPRANADFIRNIDVVFPPFAEQKTIASYLDEKCSDLGTIISIKQQKVEELKEYKKSIIYEYVTGKKEVPKLIRKHGNE